MNKLTYTRELSARILTWPLSEMFFTSHSRSAEVNESTDVATGVCTAVSGSGALSAGCSFGVSHMKRANTRNISNRPLRVFLSIDSL